MTRRKAISLVVNGHVEQTQFYYVAYCDELPITANGETLEEAVEGIVDGVVGYLDTLRKVDAQEYRKKISELLTVEDEPVEAVAKPEVAWHDALSSEKPIPIPIPEQAAEVLAHAAGY